MVLMAVLTATGRKQMKYLKCSENTHTLVQTLGLALGQSMQRLTDQAVKLLARETLNSGQLNTEWQAVVEKALKSLAGTHEGIMDKRKPARIRTVHRAG